MFSSLPPARIFLCRHVGGRGKKRASLCYEAKRRRSAVFVVAKTPPTLGITRYIVIYIYRGCKCRDFQWPWRGFSTLSIADLPNNRFPPRFDPLRAAFFLRFNKKPGQITTFEVFIDHEARDRGHTTKVETRARRNARLAPRKIAGSRKIRAVKIIPAPTVYRVTWA